MTFGCSFRRLAKKAFFPPRLLLIQQLHQLVLAHLVQPRLARLDDDRSDLLLLRVCTLRTRSLEVSTIDEQSAKHLGLSKVRGHHRRDAAILHMIRRLSPKDASGQDVRPDLLPERLEVYRFALLVLPDVGVRKTEAALVVAVEDEEVRVKAADRATAAVDVSCMA